MRQERVAVDDVLIGSQCQHIDTAQIGADSQHICDMFT
eukprot:IDg8973t1